MFTYDMSENQDLKKLGKKVHERGTDIDISEKNSINIPHRDNHENINIIDDDTSKNTSEQNIENETKKNWLHTFVLDTIDVVIDVSMLLMVYFTLQYFVVSPFIINGASMENSFENKELIMVNRLVYNNVFKGSAGPYRGDVVVFSPPIDTKEYYIKRIIGIPGDVVEFKENNVFLNGKLLNEPYTKCVSESQSDALSRLERGVCNYRGLENKAFVVPENMYFVMGDNRDHSSDSRSCFGAVNNTTCTENSIAHFVPKNNIVGKAWFIFWPINSIKLVKEYKF